MKKQMMKWLCGAVLLAAANGRAERIYNESGGRVVMEMENTESALNNWVLRPTNMTGYPAGASGSGHLEYMEPWSTTGNSPLVFKFKINTAGKYRLHFRAHKRLNPGDTGDLHNDCFVKMEGDFTSGSAEVPLAALLTNSKLYGGDATIWGRATNLDGNGADHAAAIYEFKAGEIYTFTVSGRSSQFNVDKILFYHDGMHGWPSDAVFAGLAESPLFGGPFVNAGVDRGINLPTSQITLAGSATDDGTITSYSWSQVSGPNTAVLSGQTSSNLTASGLVEGTYVFRLTVTDDEALTGTDDVTVNVVSGVGVTILGDTNLWHKITLALNGPASSEDAATNPFTDYRMDVTFTHPASGTTFVVPGYFAADGDSANTSATSGNKWLAHLRPNHAGTWNYTISFRQGSNVAMGTSSSGSAFSPYDGMTGSIDVSAVNPATAPDLRSKGRLRYVDKHHLQFEGNGEYFLKYGPDSPENFLAYFEFDNTPEAGNKGNWKTFAAHSGHYNSDGELWQSTKGANIYGAFNYLESMGANSISMLLYNVNGDGDRVFPYSSHGEMYRFDCSKLSQWERVFDHTEKKGLYLHFKLSETENDQDHDNGDLGNMRKLYYREMIARFGHHLALNWNIAEEISLTVAQRTAALQYFETNDPWQNHRVFHTAPVYDKGSYYDPHLGSSEMTGVSLQTPDATNALNVFNETKAWVTESATSGQPWVVACDEQGPGDLGVNAGFDISRKYVLWGNIMAGGGGCEYYSGGSDLTLDDYTHFDGLLETSDYAVHDFFYGENIPFWNMSNADSLLSGNTDSHCLADSAGTYVVYLIEGGTVSLDLNGVSGTFDVRWFDPRNGGSLQIGSVASVSGGTAVSLGNAPSAATEDWAVLIKLQSAPPASISFDNVNNYRNQSFEVGEDLPVSVTYSAGPTNTVNAAGIKYFLRQMNSGWSVVRDVTVFDTTVANTAFGTSTATITLPTDLIPTDSLTAGDFYFLFVLLNDEGGTKLADIGTQPIIITSTGFNRFVYDHGLIEGAAGDDDGDGQANLIEYALGGNPTNDTIFS